MGARGLVAWGGCVVLCVAFGACAVGAPRPREPAVVVAPPGSSSVVTSTSVSASASEVVPPKPRSPFAYANVDPDDDDTVGPPDARPTCDADLVAAGVSYKKDKLPLYTPPKTKMVCGAPQVVVYKGSPAKIGYSPSVLLTCTMALALARFETILQEEAQKTYGKRVVTIHHLGTYNCREMAAYPGWVSEHSYANAIDFADFVLEDGRTIEVLKHFSPKSPAGVTKEAKFLRAIAGRAYDEETFSVVLTPFFDAHHSNHFHVDLARYRSDGTKYWAP